ncbi:MAG: homoserine dehydrogenase [Luminiphilus sp.]|nr:homoserine dehydrogenase [Luminiphilus sp.]
MSAANLKIGLCGLGTVGQGVMALLSESAGDIHKKAGGPIQLTHIATRTPKLDLVGDGVKDSRDVFAVADDPEIDLVVELIGGTTVAYELVRRSLANKKHVVTANKALLAEHGAELFTLAEAQGVALRYEAAVAGGIPIIDAVKNNLAGNQITAIAGIINGTGNFILTEMTNHGRDFSDVLKEAQALGYAEADPSFDVDGTDAAQKLVLLASLAFGVVLDASAPFKQGVDSVSTADIDNARALGYRIKHLGIAKHDGQSVELRVHPTLIPESLPIATVDGVLNAVMLQASGVGELMLIGPGAGSRPTASAVCADIIAVARELLVNGKVDARSLGMPCDQVSACEITPIDEVASAWYLDVEHDDSPEALGVLEQTLSDGGIEISNTTGVVSSSSGRRHSVLVTEPATTACVEAAVSSLLELETIHGRISRLRIEAFNDA